MLCTVCEKRPVVAKGLCSACYTRKQRTGSTEYRRKGRVTYCTIEGCSEVAHATGLCFKHYQRQRKHGHTDNTRPDTWGHINAHPLIEQWNYLHHRKGVELCAPEWKTDFARFAADVGERPSPKHRLKRRDPNRLIGPDNFLWVEPEYERRPEETVQEAENRAERGRRANHPDKFRNAHIRKKYAGLSLQDVHAMSDRQNKLCAICDTETLLVVDHDHNDPEGKVRGLLCHPCNRGLGFFRDDPERLERAAGYLRNPPGEAQPRKFVRRRSPRRKAPLDTAPPTA